MKLKVLWFYSFLIPIINLIIFIVIFSTKIHTFLPIQFKIIYSGITLVFLLGYLIIMLLIIMPILLESPAKNTFPGSMHWNFDIDKVVVIEKKKGVFETTLKGKKMIFDMRGWIFKKTTVADIILAYKHCSYYNSNLLGAKYGVRQLFRKNYFKNEHDLRIEFITNKGKYTKYVIKDGLENRSAILNIKFLARLSWMPIGKFDDRGGFTDDVSVDHLYFRNFFGP